MAQTHTHTDSCLSQSTNKLSPQCNKTLPKNNCISRCNHVLHILSLLVPLMIRWHSCVPLYSTPQSLCLPCLPIVLCGLERVPQFWLQQPHWVTKSTHRVSIFNLLSVCCHSLRSASSSRVESAGCGTTRFGSRRNLLSWREISTAPRHSTAVSPPSVTALLPFCWFNARLNAHKHIDSRTHIDINYWHAQHVGTEWTEPPHHKC